MVCVIWFRWKSPVWITESYGFPVPTPHYPAHTSANSGDLWYIMPPPLIPMVAVFLLNNNAGLIFDSWLFDKWKL